MEIFAVFCNGGIGDIVSNFSYKYFANKIIANKFNYYICARDEVFEPIQYLYSNECLIQLPEDAQSFVNDSVKCREWLDKIAPHIKGQRIIFSWPDLLDRHPNSFPFEQYQVTPKRLKQHRNLTHKWHPENRIFLGLASTTEGYMHSNTAALVKMIAKQNPDYEIIFPTVSKWAGKEIDYGNLEGLPDNVKWIQDRPLTNSIDLLTTCKLAVCLDNGPSHLAYHIGMPRILLDPRWGQLPWVARWRQDISESIPLSTSAPLIATMVKQLLKDQTLDFIPRIDLLNGIIRNADWPKELIYKF